MPKIKPLVDSIGALAFCLNFENSNELRNGFGYFCLLYVQTFKSMDHFLDSFDADRSAIIECFPWKRLERRQQTNRN